MWRRVYKFISRVYLGYIEVECPNKDEVKKEPVEEEKPEPVF